MADKFDPSKLSYKELAAAYSEYQVRCRYDYVAGELEDKGIELPPEQIEAIAKEMTGYIAGEDWIWDDMAQAERDFLKQYIKDNKLDNSPPKRDVVKNAQMADKVACKDINKQK